MLPDDIAVHRIFPVKPDAHARFDARARTYNYYISDKKNPFEYEWVCRMPLNQIDFDLMNEACKILLEYDDFTSFSKLHTDVKTNLCRIIEAGWRPEGDRWVFTIQANRFLRNMVRAIVGSLFDVGRGTITLTDFRNIIEAKDRCKAGMSAPAEGLVLMEVKY
jgi:tRNA pseudouridine38-40 synthase